MDCWPGSKCRSTTLNNYPDCLHVFNNGVLLTRSNGTRVGQRGESLLSPKREILIFLVYACGQVQDVCKCGSVCLFVMTVYTRHSLRKVQQMHVNMLFV